MESRHGFESQDDSDDSPLSNDLPAANNVLCELGIQNHLHSRWYSGSPATGIFKGYTINYNNNTIYTDQTVVSSFNVHPGSCISLISNTNKTNTCKR